MPYWICHKNKRNRRRKRRWKKKHAKQENVWPERLWPQKSKNGYSSTSATKHTGCTGCSHTEIRCRNYLARSTAWQQSSWKPTRSVRRQMGIAPDAWWRTRSSRFCATLDFAGRSGLTKRNSWVRNSATRITWKPCSVSEATVMKCGNFIRHITCQIRARERSHTLIRNCFMFCASRLKCRNICSLQCQLMTYDPSNGRTDYSGTVWNLATAEIFIWRSDWNISTLNMKSLISDVFWRRIPACRQ